MKKITLYALLLLMCIALIACGKNGESKPGEDSNTEDASVESTKETEAETAEETKAEEKKNTVEHIFKAEDLRSKIVDYMRSMSAVEWTPNENFSLNGDHNTWGVDLTFKKGQKYYGLPYTRASSGLDDFSQYIENGVYKGPCGDYNTMPGNNCSTSCDLSWRRYIISTTEATYTYVPGYGNKTIAPIGNYEYPSGNRDTYKIIEKNDQQTMYEALALCKPADAIVKWSDAKAAGHARMVVADAVVVRNAAGKINASRSYLVVVEQTNKLTTVNGKQSTWLVDKKYSFAELLNDGYVPVTPTALAEETELKVSYKDINTSENIVSTLAGTLEMTCSVSGIEMTVTNEKGEVVKNYTIEPENGTAKLTLRKYTYNLDVASLPAGKYNYKLEVHTPALGSATLLEIPFEK